MDYVTLRSYDGKLVNVPVDKKDKYIKTQQLIKKYIDEEKSIEEIKRIVSDDNE